MSLLVTDVTVGDRPGRAVHVVDGRIAWLGAAADAPRAPTATVAGEGALLTPAFVDAHVHATATGLALSGLDLHWSSSLARRRRAVDRALRGAPRTASCSAPAGTRPAGRRGAASPAHDLDAVVGDRPAYLARVDVHSATVSTALLDRVPGITEPAGLLTPTASCGSTPTTPRAGPPTGR